MITSRERAVLRDLACRVAEVAELPVMTERRELWKRHNRLERVRPMVLIFPEGAWRELLPRDAMECESEAAREYEWGLRSRLYQHEHLPCDGVIEKEWVVQKAIYDDGWGLAPRHEPSDDPVGAWAFDPVIQSAADLKKLRPPTVHHDEAASRRAYEEAADLFGDILDVQLRGLRHISFHLMAIYTRLRGLAETMLDMADNPGMLHDAMALLRDGHQRLIDQYEEQNLLSLNNDGTYHSSGGVGYTTELPLPDCDPQRVRPCDMWASAESQELAQVSPEMHETFALAYERPLLARFGLNGYGCCEDLTRKLDRVLTIPRIRRISISPWADVDACAVTLGSRAIFSWKPNPAMLVGAFDPARVEASLRHTLEVTRGCVIEMILKDTHTCERQPERFTQWGEIAMQLAEEYA